MGRKEKGFFAFVVQLAFVLSPSKSLQHNANFKELCLGPLG
jgi:hypothetical protein